MTLLAIALGGLALAVVAGWGWHVSRLLAERAALRADLASLRSTLDARSGELDALRADLASARDSAAERQSDAAALRERIRALEEADRQKASLIESTDARIREAFGALAANALKANSEQFVALARQSLAVDRKDAQADMDARRKAVEDLLKPIGEALKRTDEKLAAMEKERGQAYAGLLQQVRAMQETGERLRARTDDLVSALRKPQVRGAYGEMVLERVIELSGMRSYCHFQTQAAASAGDGSRLRPDVVVALPNGRTVVIDAKTNIEAYLDALHAESPEERDAHLDRFARHVADQADALSRKGYAGAVDGSHEFVVMFIPGDQFVDAALERRPDLLERATEHGVILASPSTLIGLLRAVHVGWREKALSDHAEELFVLGRTLHERVGVALSHASRVGESIERAQKAWNQFVGSVSSRLLPAVRTFEERGARSQSEIGEPVSIDGEVRSLPEVETRPLTPGAARVESGGGE